MKTMSLTDFVYFGILKLWVETTALRQQIQNLLVELNQ